MHEGFKQQTRSVPCFELCPPAPQLATCPPMSAQFVPTYLEGCQGRGPSLRLKQKVYSEGGRGYGQGTMTSGMSWKSKLWLYRCLVLQTIYKSETKYEELILIQQEQIDLEFCLFEGSSQQRIQVFSGDTDDIVFAHNLNLNSELTLGQQL